jgi:PKD repeat protein
LDIKSPPIASFSYCPKNPVVNETITFNASFSDDPDGTIENYEWDFGDGNITNITEPNYHSFLLFGKKLHRKTNGNR